MDTKITYIERQKPLAMRVIAAILITAAFALLAFFVYHIEFSLKERRLRVHTDLIQIIAFLIFFAVYLSYTINCYFDFENRTFKREKTIGFFKYGKWKPLPELEYVSLFAVNHMTFEINLWYKKNKHWDLYEKYEIKEAFTIAFELSELLNIDLLDATIPNNFRWIDKKASKEKGEMVYFS